MSDQRRNRTEHPRQYQPYDDYGQHQPEQFEAGDFIQAGEYPQGAYGERSQMGDADHRYRRRRRPDYTVGDLEERAYIPASRHQRRQREAAQRDYEEAAAYENSYGPPRMINRTGLRSRSFTSEDQGGGDFVIDERRRYGGRGYAAPHYGSYADPYHDRGLLERATDEVASWFGDEDAARRREEDHRGRGPGNYTRSNERILEDACDSLTDDRVVDASNIEVTVEDGEVTLNGTVSSRRQKRRAEDCVDCISGVSHVQNNLRVDQEAASQRTTGVSPLG